MLRYAYMVIGDKGESLHLDQERAFSYAVKTHGRVIRMIGQDNGPVSKVEAEVLEDLTDVPV